MELDELLLFEEMILVTIGTPVRCRGAHRTLTLTHAYERYWQLDSDNSGTLTFTIIVGNLVKPLLCLCQLEYMQHIV